MRFGALLHASVLIKQHYSGVCDTIQTDEWQEIQLIDTIYTFVVLSDVVHSVVSFHQYPRFCNKTTIVMIQTVTEWAVLHHANTTTNLANMSILSILEIVCTASLSRNIWHTQIGYPWHRSRVRFVYLISWYHYCVNIWGVGEMGHYCFVHRDTT